MFNLSQYFLSLGVPQETILYLVGLTAAATLVAFARQIVGIKGFGIYTSLLIALSFLALGLKYGLVTFAVVVIVGTITRLLLKELRLSYLPRMAIVFAVVILALLLTFLVAGYVSSWGILNAPIFAILIMIILVEKFIAAQIDKGGRAAVLLTVETVFLAVVSYLLISWPPFQRLVFNFPLVIIFASLLINVFLGKWTGLRLFEYWRFKDVLGKD